MALQPSDILSTIDSEQFNEFEQDTTTSSTIDHLLPPNLPPGLRQFKLLSA
jgi:hypothetical protein